MTQKTPTPDTKPRGIMVNLTPCSETAHLWAQYAVAEVRNRPQTQQKCQIIPSGSLWCQIGYDHLCKGNYGELDTFFPNDAFVGAIRRCSRTEQATDPANAPVCSLRELVVSSRT